MSRSVAIAVAALARTSRGAAWDWRAPYVVRGDDLSRLRARPVEQLEAGRLSAVRLGLPRDRAVAMPAATITLSFLAHAAVGVSLVFLLPSRSEPPLIPPELAVVLRFEAAPAVVPPPGDVASVAVPDIKPMPTEPAPPETPTIEPTPPPVPQPSATPAPPPPPTRPAQTRTHSPPARPRASPTPPVSPPPAQAQTAATGSPLPAATGPLILPRPVAGMETNRKPVYPEIALRRREEGRVMLRVSVSADGTPLEVDLAETSGHPSLDSAALSTVRQWRFIPAMQAGRAVAAIALVPVRFRLGN